MKIIVSLDNTDSIDCMDLVEGIVKNKFYFNEKSLKEILSFLRLEFKGIGSLMHLLVWCKHFSNYKDINLNIKFIEEKCDQELNSLVEEKFIRKLKNSIKNYSNITPVVSNLTF